MPAHFGGTRRQWKPVPFLSSPACFDFRRAVCSVFGSRPVCRFAFAAAGRFAPRPSSHDWVAPLLGYVLVLASEPVGLDSCAGCAADFRFSVLFQSVAHAFGLVFLRMVSSLPRSAICCPACSWAVLRATGGGQVPFFAGVRSLGLKSIFCGLLSHADEVV
jgi:hypothetical protein